MISILRSDRSDAKAILELQKLAYHAEAKIYNDFFIPPLVQPLHDLEAEYGSHVFLKVVWHREIIGSVRACEKDGTCHIGRLIVHPDHQNRGIGKELMNRIEAEFPGTRRFELFTGTKSEKNLAFYKKLGYGIVRYEKLNDKVEFAFLEKMR
jgi:ribosomal protein S18 acetylase RimI-like enzyme